MSCVTCSMLHITPYVQHATHNMQRTPADTICYIKYATHSTLDTMCYTKCVTYNMLHTIQHADIQYTTYSIEHATCYTQQASKHCLLQDTWRDSKYSMQMLVSLAEAMQRCWRATDALFGSIQDWSAQPIDVRHPFSFYYGHLASFAKLKMLSWVRQTVATSLLERRNHCYVNEG